MYSYFRNSGLDARDPFAFTQALAPGEIFDPTTNSVGLPIKNSLARYQFGGPSAPRFKKDKTFVFLSFEGLRQDSEQCRSAADEHE